MGLRFKIYSVLAAMLYFGPLLAGLSGTAELALPVFVAIFTLWIVVMRPAIWARVTQDGTPLALAVYLAGITLMQILLVILCFGLGRGLSAVLGGALDIPQWVPVLLSALALPLARLIWNPQRAAEIDAFTDQALKELDARAATGQKPGHD